ncbi:cyclic nucleotide-gated channel rod photoreceptor subunit alpha-like isoform X2 [Limulus polyphemus]|uniref:Cyclic nucleotide-gated channel rod photoreceptor subunit alpha-like isoform X2 n=1 Tax=Limulus polyphemus TaxID=6850 RepID=A0ABM1BZM8_LIMPO|nr:cyclic nucleotide-gated channel rod photoreceptor subunit alpha-like isoform X2 [Limulus polyphemus]
MRSNDPCKTVKYKPYTKEGPYLDNEVNEIVVVSNAASESVEYGTGTLTANGPRVIPGIITSIATERVRLVSEERPNANSVRLQAPSPLCSAKSSENLNLKSASRQSLLETLTSKFHTGDMKRRSRDSVAFVNKAHINFELEVSRKTREQRRKEIKREFEKLDTSSAGSDRNGCNWTFVFDPSGRLCYYWSMIVSVAFLYNFWVIIYRFSFQEINKDTLVAWFTLDYIADFLYILDICFHFRAGYLEEGVLQTDHEKLRKHYMNSTMFYIDCLCLLPLDFLYLSIGFNSILRCLRLVKIYRFWAFLDRTERHTNYPNVFRTLSLIHYFLVIFHWNACLFHIISTNGGFGSRDWFNSRGENCVDVLCEYLHSFYWSTLAWTTVGDLPRPRTRGEYMFLILELVFGLFFFAAVLGHVANIVTNVSAARKEFQAKLDAVKTYMRMRRVPDHLQNKVIKWFDYLWMTQKSSDEERSVGCLPDKLKAEIAIHVHLDTLKRVEIFQNTEAGFLCELVLRLRPVLFSPGDYICRKGEVGKEMFIVNHGRLQVVTDNGKTVLATLRAGSYFGEISILNMGTAGNRRTASVRSVGYSDLFCLYKHDMWDVLKDYPAARVRLEAIAVKRLEKYRKDPLRKIAMGRSRSTPGLVESRGRVSLEEMQVDPRDPSASTSYLLADDVPQKMTEILVPSCSASKASSRKISNVETCNKTFTQYESLGPIPSIIYIPQSPRATSNCSFTTDDSKDKKQGLEGISHSKLLCLRPTSSYFAHSPAFNMLNGSLMTDCSALSSTSADQVFFGGPPSHSSHLSVPSPIAGGSGSASPISIHTSGEYHQDMLLSEIKHLRERLLALEAENASMSRKHSQPQWEVENRLAEIELQIYSASSTSVDDSERNRESAI